MSIIEKCFGGRKNAHKCVDCYFWDPCRGMCKQGDCFRPSDAFTIKSTIESMLNTYGEDSQIDVCIEEMSELIKELVKYKRSKIHFREKEAASREHVIEEIGDVLFTFEYLKHIFCISQKDIDQVMLEKALRTKERYINAKK